MISFSNAIWIFLVVLFCFNMLLIWIMYKSKKWRKVRRYGTAPMLFMFITPFIDQPAIFENILGQLSGIIILLLGLTIWTLSSNEFRKRGIIRALIRKESSRFHPEQVSHLLVTTGVYRIFRHPQYVGQIIILIGYAVLFNALYSLYLTPLILSVFLVLAIVEEKYDLELIFGDEYKEYKKEVGLFLPKIRRRK